MLIIRVDLEVANSGDYQGQVSNVNSKTGLGKYHGKCCSVCHLLQVRLLLSTSQLSPVGSVGPASPGHLTVRELLET